MKKKRGFKLRSGNDIVGKGSKPSNFKMMGASPAKRTDVFTTRFDPDTGEETVERIGTGEKAQEQGLAIEKANERKRLYNIESSKMADRYEKLLQKQNELAGSKDPKERAQFDVVSAEMNAIQRGEFEGGRPTTNVTYTDKDAEARDLLAQGYKKTRMGTFPVEREGIYPVETGGGVTLGDKEEEARLIQQIKSQRGMPMKKKGFKMKRKK